MSDPFKFINNGGGKPSGLGPKSMQKNPWEPQLRPCYECAAWLNHKPHINRLGECHRRSPQETGDGAEAVWPLTEGTDGCFDSLPREGT